MLVENLIVESGGPKPTEQTNTTCQCGGTCGGDCKCGGTCGGDCGCGGKDLTTLATATTIPELVKNTSVKVEKASKKYFTTENLLIFAIALSVGAATYTIINE